MRPEKKFKGELGRIKEVIVDSWSTRDPMLFLHFSVGFMVFMAISACFIEELV